MSKRSFYSCWCDDCCRHESQCVCDPEKNIYLVEYKMSIDSGLLPIWCLERVRCVAYDNMQASSIVDTWLKHTDVIWWKEEGEVVERKVPAGNRDVWIINIQIYAKDVSELLKLCPLPEIFPHED